MNKIVKREVLPLLISHLKEKEITLIHGARQVGKTTLVHCLIDHLKNKLHVPESQILYYNLDLFYQFEKIVDQKSFIQFLIEKCRNVSPLYLFIDEAQYLPETGRYLKGLYDLGLPIKLIVTGSSSFLLARNTNESLMGRKQVFTVGTFSFAEFMAYEKDSLLSLFKEKKISSIHRDEIIMYLMRYLLYGGYPQVVLTSDKQQKEQRLQEIYSSYIDKDVSMFLDIRNKMGFSRVISLLADQISNLVNVSEVSNTTQLSHATVKNYLQSLEDTYIIAFNRPIASNVRSELIKMPKIYFLDPGLRNCVLKNFNLYQIEREKGKLLENFVYISLYQAWKDKLHYWRSKDKAEVDFIIEKENQNWIPIEVKATMLSKPIIGKSMHSYLKSYPCTNAYVVNLSIQSTIRIGETNINFILPWQMDILES